MMRNFEKKLLGYAAVASAGGLMVGTSAQAAIVGPTSFTGVPNNGGTLNDESKNAFLSMGNDSQTNVNGTADAGVHLYVTNNKDSDSATYLYTGSAGTGALANLAPGYVVGPSPAGGLKWEGTINGTDNDIAYIDSVTGMQFTPAADAGNTPDQFSLNTNGYFGFTLTPTAGTTDYGWAEVNYNSAGVENVTYSYDDAGNPVFVGGGVAVPEPSSLALLAFGTIAGLRRTRKN